MSSFSSQSNPAWTFFLSLVAIITSTQRLNNDNAMQVGRYLPVVIIAGVIPLPTYWNFHYKVVFWPGHPFVRKRKCPGGAGGPVSKFIFRQADITDIWAFWRSSAQAFSVEKFSQWQHLAEHSPSLIHLHSLPNLSRYCLPRRNLIWYF